MCEQGEDALLTRSRDGCATLSRNGNCVLRTDSSTQLKIMHAELEQLLGDDAKRLLEHHCNAQVEQAWNIGAVCGLAANPRRC